LLLDIVVPRVDDGMRYRYGAAMGFDEPVAIPLRSPPQNGAKVADSHDPARRALLATLLAVYAASFIPSAVAAPAGEAGRDAFLAASKLLTGRPSLGSDDASRLYDALAADDPQFPAKVQALQALIEQGKIDPLDLQQVLDGESSALGALPRKIVTAWYTGVVGEGENARCVTFETNLLNVIVDDHLKPPSYCYGVYGSWAQKPM
jgi:hypothetical protein